MGLDGGEEMDVDLNIRPHVLLLQLMFKFLRVREAPLKDISRDISRICSSSLRVRLARARNPSIGVTNIFLLQDGLTQ